MYDAIEIPFNEQASIIIATDNSGAIGMKKLDEVVVPYEVVAYFAFRVAAMECLAAGGQPFSVVIHNFCGDEEWVDITRGIKKGLQELALTHLPITGSTESNFPLVQSALGVIVLGKKERQSSSTKVDINKMEIAVIGVPLVGDEVVERSDEIIPLSLVRSLLDHKDVQFLLPVGSTGILAELRRLFPGLEEEEVQMEKSLDLFKSGGPATSVIIAYLPAGKEDLQKLVGEQLFCSLTIEKINT